MRKGKTICNTLKAVRKQIAEANDIRYEPRECNHEGDCMGTCPACESEVRYLQRELDLRRQLGKAVAVIGISAGVAGLTSCNFIGGGGQLAGMPEVPDSMEMFVNGEDSTLNDSVPLATKVAADSTSSPATPTE